MWFDSMSDIAIHVSGISKVYRLGESRERYQTLRDSIVKTLSAPFRSVARAYSRPPSTDDEEWLWALRDVTFEVHPGEVVGIIGRNGAGKSTLLKVLSRITDPTSGYADVWGKVGCLLEVGSGFHPELTGRENIFLNGAILGMRRSEIKRRFDEIVDFAEVERFIDTPVKRFSSGMYLRLAFAVAAHLEPDILVVDEVLAVGDFNFQNKCLSKMQDVSGEGRTVLFVSHNMAAIHRLCSRTILLHQGQILEDGPTDQVIQAYVSAGLVERPEYIQSAAPEKAITLRRACLRTTDGRLANEFRYDESITVQVEYEVNQGLSGCSVWVGIWTAEGAPVFGTADTDHEEGAQLLGSRQPGYYRTEVEIPKMWLNVGVYQVVVGIGRFAWKESFDRVELSSFRVLEVGTLEAGRPGILQPLLDWKPPDRV
jgi:homopolymeric O-antigen transport system ATP-binding protein